MKKKTIVRCLLTLLPVSLTLVSCIDDPEPPVLDARTDVFIQKIQDNGDDQYALAFWIAGNKGLDSVAISGPEGGTWTIEGGNNNPQVLTMLPDKEDYSATMPPAGDYTFKVTSTQSGEAPLLQKDELEEEELGVVMIDTVKFTDLKLNISWGTVSGTDNYLVRLFDEEGDLIFLSNQIENDETDYKFGTTDNGWLNTSRIPLAGDSCRIEILALLYESSAITDKDYNLQCISLDSEDIEWE